LKWFPGTKPRERKEERYKNESGEEQTRERRNATRRSNKKHPLVNFKLGHKRNSCSTSLLRLS
jgi:hypothetical protein